MATEKLKQKEKASWMPQNIPYNANWRSRELDKELNQLECVAMLLPFEIYLETVDCYPS
jgi:hypothetical protein